MKKQEKKLADQWMPKLSSEGKTKKAFIERLSRVEGSAKFSKVGYNKGINKTRRQSVRQTTLNKQ